MRITLTELNNLICIHLEKGDLSSLVVSLLFLTFFPLLRAGIRILCVIQLFLLVNKSENHISYIYHETIDLY